LQSNNFLNVNLNSIKDILLKAQRLFYQTKDFDSNKSRNAKVDQKHLVRSWDQGSKNKAKGRQPL
jgi:poly(A) polymerase Pap1